MGEGGEGLGHDILGTSMGDGMRGQEQKITPSRQHKGKIKFQIILICHLHK